MPLFAQSCLLYAGIFPPEMDIPIRRLLHLWVAEGFLVGVKHPNNEITDEDDLAKCCFDELVGARIIEITSQRADGRPKTCRMPRIVREHFSRHAQSVGFFHVLPKSKAENKSVRRLITYSDIVSYPSLNHYIQHLRTYVSFNTGRQGAITCKEMNMFLNYKPKGMQGFTLLGILDLEGVYKPSIPEPLGKLFPILIYLGLRSTALDSIPESIGDLIELQSLDVKHTFISTLPTSVCKLIKLRHLYMNWIQMPDKQPNLEDLHTLWGLSVRDDSRAPIDWLSNCISLRELGLTCLSMNGKLNSSFQQDLYKSIANLRQLRYLMLRATDKSGVEPSVLDNLPQDLSNLTHLTDLYLLGRLTSSNGISNFPRRIQVLTLSLSGLDKDPMTLLKEFHDLKILRLFAESYLGETMRCSTGVFPKLIALKLWKLPKLREWTVEEGALTSLKELEIRGCDNLDPPKGLINLAKMEEMKLTNVDFNKWKQLIKNVEEKCPHAYVTVKQRESTPLKDVDA